MKKFFFLLMMLPLFVQAQVTQEQYKRAEQFLGFNIDNILYHKWVDATWSKNKQFFTWRASTATGAEFYYIDLKTKQKKLCFNNDDLAILLTEKQKKLIAPDKLPFSEVEMIDANTFLFVAGLLRYTYIPSKKLLAEENADYQPKNTEIISPDKNLLAYIDAGNIFIKNIKTGEKTALTTDGLPETGYGHELDWYFVRNDSKKEKNNFVIDAYWSKDSKKLIVPKYDRTKTRRLQLYKVMVDSGYQSEIYSYERALAGDTVLTTIEYYVFDINTKKQTKIDLPPTPAFLGSYVYFFDNCPKAYRIVYSRGYKSRTLYEIDLETGKTRKVLTEENKKTYVDLYTESLEVNYSGNEFIWRSEQDGWSMLYLYDLTTGKIKNQITKGNFYVYEINHTDFKTGTIWFTAGGYDKYSDPYFKQIFSIKTNGKDLKQLTTEIASHSFEVSNDGNYFIDNYSSYWQPVVSVLRQMSDGKIVMEISREDISQLANLGWKPAEPFITTAPDGTAIYCLIYKPTNFDPAKKYPVIDGTYTGPHTIRAPKTFNRTVSNMDMALAELGFIVVNIDGRGSAYRSKAFHDKSYARLGYSLDDHVLAIRNMAKQFSYIDTNRVGIYGHSAGGYDATRALLQYPDFYKVGVSSAADHDHRMEKEWWPELYQGFPVDTQYYNQSNVTNAHKLKGKLMLVTGDMDNNVNPSATYKVAAELVKANKDFELIILPNDDHSSCWWNHYFIRKRWDFFVKNLMGAEHPFEYKIK